MLCAAGSLLHRFSRALVRSATAGLKLPRRGGPGDDGSMSLDRLKWLTILLPLIFVAAIQICVMLVLEPALGSTVGHWLAFAIIAVGVIVFSTSVFRVLGEMQREILHQNEEAQGPYGVGLGRKF